MPPTSALGRLASVVVFAQRRTAAFVNEHVFTNLTMRPVASRKVSALSFGFLQGDLSVLELNAAEIVDGAANFSTGPATLLMFLSCTQLPVLRIADERIG